MYHREESKVRHGAHVYRLNVVNVRECKHYIPLDYEDFVDQEEIYLDMYDDLKRYDSSLAYANSLIFRAGGNPNECDHRNMLVDELRNINKTMQGHREWFENKFKVPIQLAFIIEENM